jgi:small conductance mechanosensitive channel
VQWTAVATAAAIVTLIAWITAHVTARLARLVFLRLIAEDDRVSFKAPIVRTPIRIIWSVVFLLVAATLAQPALEAIGARIEGGLHLRTLVAWLLRSGLRVSVIVLLAYVAMRFVATLVRRLQQRAAGGEGASAAERAKRAKTLGGLVQNVVNTTLIAVALLMVLQELDINIVPVLTGAGIAGLAVGFGAQTLVKDVIGGFFLILEDQIRVGDVASIGGISGLVEAINLRTIVLRDLTGTVHVIPNGSVDLVSNLTKDFSYFVLDMDVAYKENTDEVVDVMREVAEGLRKDPGYAASILEPLEVLGVDDFGDSGVVIKVRLKTVPPQQWGVGREFRRRIKKAFDARGIEIPFPHRSVYFGQASKPWLVRQADGGTPLSTPASTAR